MAVPPDVRLRSVPEELCARYRREGLWSDDTLGCLIDGSVQTRPALPLRIWSVAAHAGRAAAAATITDRKKDIIIRGGANISAAEVEELLAQLPSVAEVAVVAAPDPRLGEHACAFVRPRDGAAAPELAVVCRHLEAAGLAKPKWPEELRVVEDFPRTPSGKIKKVVLREALRAEARKRG